MKRSNPVQAPIGRKALSENVVHPVAGPDNTGPGLGKKGNLPKKPKRGSK